MSDDPKLNIFNELKELDTRNTKFYKELTPEQKKKIGMYPIIRWASGVKSSNTKVQEFYIESMNEANKLFFDLAKHPELQWMLLASCGLGASVRHEWIPTIKKTNTNKLDKLLFDCMPYLNHDELSIVKKKITVDDIKDICKQYGMLDSEIKEYVNEVKKIKK